MDNQHCKEKSLLLNQRVNQWLSNFSQFFDLMNLQEIFSLENPTCYTCKTQIENLPFRFLIVQDNFKNESVLGFHYFYPCWDVNYICNNLPGLKILKAGFCYDEYILKSPAKIKNMKRNIELWDL